VTVEGAAGGPASGTHFRSRSRSDRSLQNRRSGGPPGRLFLRWMAPLSMTAFVYVAVFLFYELIYRVRHFSLPLGFDAPWYVWRADFVAVQGLGALDTNARPGQELLTANLHSVTGLSALQLQVVLPYVLVGVFALALGVLIAEELGRGEPWRWVVGAGVAGGLIGTTRLVGENVANLTNVLLVAVGFLFLLRFIRLRRGFAGAVLMLLAAGLAHWLFLGLFGVAMAVWFLMALPASKVELGSVWETEAGALFSIGAVTGAAMGAIICPILHSQLRTFEIHEAKRRYIPKLREDLGALRLAFTAPLAALGGAALWKERAGRGPFLRMLAAWTAVTLGGIAVAAATKVLPPHRFLAILVAGPIVVAIAAAVLLATTWLRARAGLVAAAVLAVVAVAAVAVPAALSWYRTSTGPQQFWDATAFQQAREANAYIQTLPPGRRVIFLLSPLGPFGPISTPEKERIIRAAISPNRQTDVYFYPGTYRNLLAGRFTPGPNTAIDRENRPYWRAVRPLLPRHPPILLLRAFAPPGAYEVFTSAPGMLVLRGPAASIPHLSPVQPVPTSRVAAAWAIALGALLFAAGIGWTGWFLGRGAAPITLVALSPAVGVGMLMLSSLVTAKTGAELGGTAGIVTFAVVAVAGWLLAVLRRQRA